MDVKCIWYPIKTFSHFDFFHQKSLELQLRHTKLHGKNAKQNLQQIHFVKLCLCKSPRSKKFPIEINDLLENWETDKEEIGETMRYTSLKFFERCQSASENSISLLLVDSNSKLDFVSLDAPNIYTIFIDRDDNAKTRQEFQDEDNLKFTIAKKDTISTVVNNLLERVSMAPLKKIAEDCHGKFGKDKKVQSRDTAEYLPSTESVNVGNKFRKVETEAGIRPAKPSKCYQNGFVIDDKFGQTDGGGWLNPIYPRLESRSKLQALPKGKKDKRKRSTESDKVEVVDVKSRSMDHVDTDESLLEAILALYRMSNVPDTDRPNVPSQTYIVRKELRDELFKVCPSIKRMGYRYRTFTIYAAKPEKYEDEVKRNSRIESILKTYGIDKFDLLPCIDDIIPLTHVGAKIEARSGRTISLRSRSVCTYEIIRHGTLGCIAGMSDGRQCGLLSKHVTQDCSEVYYNNDNQKEKLGDMIPETNLYRPKSLDISAALMDKNVDDSKRKFENMQGHKVKGKLYHYNEDQEDNIFGAGQPVFIRGARSNPGKGEITMPFADVGLPTALIQVEDAISAHGTVQGRFAEKGDSGAVVCADVPDNCVYALGMVMGECGGTSKTRREYLALPLSKGKEQLEAETGRKFDL